MKFVPLWQLPIAIANNWQSRSAPNSIRLPKALHLSSTGLEYGLHQASGSNSGYQWSDDKCGNAMEIG
jgi:hypothetical protein